MIPPLQARAAVIAGRLHARGVLHAAELLEPILTAATRARPNLPAAPLRTRLIETIRGAAAAWEEDRTRAGWAVRRAAKDALAARMAPARVLTLAHAADRDEALWAEEREEIILLCLAEAVRGRR